MDGKENESVPPENIAAQILSGLVGHNFEGQIQAAIFEGNLPETSQKPTLSVPEPTKPSCGKIAS